MKLEKALVPCPGAAAVYEFIYHERIYRVEDSDREHIVCAKWIKQQCLCDFTGKVDKEQQRTLGSYKKKKKKKNSDLGPRGQVFCFSMREIN